MKCDQTVLCNYKGYKSGIKDAQIVSDESLKKDKEEREKEGGIGALWTGRFKGTGIDGAFSRTPTHTFSLGPLGSPEMNSRKQSNTNQDAMKIQTNNNRRRLVGLVWSWDILMFAKAPKYGRTEEERRRVPTYISHPIQRWKSSNNLVFHWTVCDVTAVAFTDGIKSPHISQLGKITSYLAKAVGDYFTQSDQIQNNLFLLIIQSAHHRPTSHISLLHVVWSYVSKQRIICLTLFSLSKRHLLTCDSSQMPQLSVVVVPNLSICMKKKKTVFTS